MGEFFSMGGRSRKKTVVFEGGISKFCKRMSN
jgi:hypothetical protein